MAVGTYRTRVPLGVVAGRILAILLILLLLGRVVTSLEIGARDDGNFYVYVLDVGQSDAILLRTGEKTMLIDTGTATESEALLAALMRYDIKALDYLVLTHPHEDHIGNARRVLETVAVTELLLPAAQSAELAYSLICDEAEARGVSIESAQTGQRFALGEAAVEVLCADAALADADMYGESADVNNTSTVLRVVFGTQVFLFMGDAEESLEAQLLADYGSEYLDCDFLKVGHHGSESSTTAPFLAALTPAVAAISCGKNNTYGFPHAAVLQNLTAVGAEIYRTDESGTLAFGTDGSELRLIPSNTKGF